MVKSRRSRSVLRVSANIDLLGHSSQSHRAFVAQCLTRLIASTLQLCWYRHTPAPREHVWAPRRLVSTHSEKKIPGPSFCCYLPLPLQAHSCKWSTDWSTDATDSPDCLPILLSISVFLLFSFSLFQFLVVRSVRTYTSWLLWDFERTLK